MDVRLEIQATVHRSHPRSNLIRYRHLFFRGREINFIIIGLFILECTYDHICANFRNPRRYLHYSKELLALIIESKILSRRILRTVLRKV